MDTDSTEDTDLYPACVVTRAMAKKEQDNKSFESQTKPIVVRVDLSDTFFGNIKSISKNEKDSKKTVSYPLPTVEHHSLTRKQLIEEQFMDPELLELRKKNPLPEEAGKVPRGGRQGSRMLLSN